MKEHKSILLPPNEDKEKNKSNNKPMTTCSLCISELQKAAVVAEAIWIWK